MYVWFGMVLTVSVVMHSKGQSYRNKSIACTNGSPCKTHLYLVCEESQCVKVVSASFGFKRDCPASITNTECPVTEVQRCCSEEGPVPDCFVPFNSATLTNMHNACANTSTCSFEIPRSPDEIVCGSRTFYSYTKVEFTCEQKASRRPDDDDDDHVKTDEDDISDNTLTPVILGLVFGILVVVASVVGVIIYLSSKRKRSKNELQEKLANNETKPGNPRVIVDETVNYCSGDGYESSFQGPQVVLPLTNDYTEIDENDFAKHSQFDLDEKACNRIEVDNSNVIKSLEDTYNHIVEDNSTRNINKHVDETYNHIPSVGKPIDDNYQHIGESRWREDEDNSEYSHIR